MKKYITILVAVLFVSCLALSCFADCPSMDATGDCQVDIADFAVFAEQWLTEGVRGPYDMVWVYINDPGVSTHEPFNGYMSKYETTNAQYCQFLNTAKASGAITVSGNYVVGTSGPYSGQNYYNLAGAGYNYNGAINGGASRIHYSSGVFTVDPGFDYHPVTYVSWYGATAFCNYYGYRLPTEWEWQAVADFDGTYTYGCGTSINNSIANYLNSVHLYGTNVVGSIGNPSGYGYGICDMAGSVDEWAKLPSGTYYLVCGGNWTVAGINCLVSSRSSPGATSMGYNVGFRVCR